MSHWWEDTIGVLTKEKDELRTEIARLRTDLKDQRELYRHDVAKLMDKIERLGWALRPFAEAHDTLLQQVEPVPMYHSVPVRHLAVARAALDGKEE